jgi:hypothetical protein
VRGKCHPPRLVRRLQSTCSQVGLGGNNHVGRLGGLTSEAESKAERGRNQTPLTLFSLDDLGGKMAQPQPPSASFGDLGQGFQVAHNNGSIHTVYNDLPGTNRFPLRLQKFSVWSQAG